MIAVIGATGTIDKIGVLITIAPWLLLGEAVQPRSAASRPAFAGPPPPD